MTHTHDHLQAILSLALATFILFYDELLWQCCLRSSNRRPSRARERFQRLPSGERCATNDSSADSCFNYTSFNACSHTYIHTCVPKQLSVHKGAKNNWANLALLARPDPSRSSKHPLYCSYHSDDKRLTDTRKLWKLTAAPEHSETPFRWVENRKRIIRVRNTPNRPYVLCLEDAGSGAAFTASVLPAKSQRVAMTSTTRVVTAHLNTYWVRVACPLGETKRKLPRRYTYTIRDRQKSPPRARQYLRAAGITVHHRRLFLSSGTEAKKGGRHRRRLTFVPWAFTQRIEAGANALSCGVARPPYIYICMCLAYSSDESHKRYFYC